MVKKHILYLFVYLIAIAATGCSGDSATAGSGVLDSSDGVIVGCDTFQLTSNLREGEYIYTTPDSFLIGECETMFGTLHADLLAQFSCPEGFKYPETAVVDSICLFMYYTSYHGDGHTPLSLNVYEMDGEVMQFTGIYSSGEDLGRFCSKQKSLLNQPRIIVAESPTDSVYNDNARTYVPYVRFRMQDEFAQRFFQIKDFSTQEAFNELFKGLYITSEFGGATILHVSDLNLAVYYHYTYQQLYDDSIRTENDVKGFYASTEVRQINRYELINPQMDDLVNTTDSIDYIVSPGYIFTSLNIPMQMMSDTILHSIDNKRAYVNQAKIYVEVLNYYEGSKTDMARDDWAQPSQYMLLIKETALGRFFREKELPSDTCAILGTLTYQTDSVSNKHYYYSYDLSTLLTNQLRNMAEDLSDTLHMVLVPVDVTTAATSSSSSSITAVKHKQTVSATAIRSANEGNGDTRMQLEVVYSGF